MFRVVALKTPLVMVFESTLDLIDAPFHMKMLMYLHVKTRPMILLDPLVLAVSNTQDGRLPHHVPVPEQAPHEPVVVVANPGIHIVWRVRQLLLSLFKPLRHQPFVCIKKHHPRRLERICLKQPVPFFREMSVPLELDNLTPILGGNFTCTVRAVGINDHDVSKCLDVV